MIELVIIGMLVFSVLYVAFCIAAIWLFVKIIVFLDQKKNKKNKKFLKIKK